MERGPNVHSYTQSCFLILIKASETNHTNDDFKTVWSFSVRRSYIIAMCANVFGHFGMGAIHWKRWRRKQMILWFTLWMYRINAFSFESIRWVSGFFLLFTPNCKTFVSFIMVLAMIKSQFIAPDEYAKIKQIPWMDTSNTFNFHIFTMNTTQINETHRHLAHIICHCANEDASQTQTKTIVSEVNDSSRSFSLKCHLRHMYRMDCIRARKLSESLTNWKKLQSTTKQ